MAQRRLRGPRASMAPSSLGMGARHAAATKPAASLRGAQGTDHTGATGQLSGDRQTIRAAREPDRIRRRFWQRTGFAET